MRKTSTAPKTSAIEVIPLLRSIALVGPSHSENPSTSRRFPTTLPLSDPRTTSYKPSLTANSEMISSGAFPNVAFRKPPTPGPVCWAAFSVASPINHASGTSETAASTKSGTSPACAAQSTIMVIGARPRDAHRSRRATGS